MHGFDCKQSCLISSKEAGSLQEEGEERRGSRIPKKGQGGQEPRSKEGGKFTGGGRVEGGKWDSKEGIGGRTQE